MPFLGGLLSSFSWLDLLWLGQEVVFVGPSLLYVLATGYHSDKSASAPDLGSAHKQLSFYQFRKNVGRYYLAGLVFSTWITWLAVGGYFFGFQRSERLGDLLDLVASPRSASTDGLGTSVACGLFMLHMARRVYECWQVSIFSGRHILNLLDLAIGYILYPASALTLVAYAPAFDQIQGGITWSDFKWNHAAGAAVFLLASIHQYRASKIFSNLRKNKSGHIVTTGYKVPTGDWFNYVSCPHYLCESLIYGSLNMMVGFGNPTLLLLTLYVVTNQVYMALNTHMWYQQKFDDQPKDRKMIVPFLL